MAQFFTSIQNWSLWENLKIYKLRSMRQNSEKMDQYGLKRKIQG